MSRRTMPPHPFVADPDVPPDHRGLRACAAPGCRLMGAPGDAHHTLPERPEAADARELAAHEED